MFDLIHKNNTCTLYLKKSYDVMDVNFNKDYKILIISGTNIADTTGHQMVTSSHLTQSLFLH